MTGRRFSTRHVYWLGGGSGAGKSTVANRIAEERGALLYSTDDVMPEHARRTAAAAAPYLSQFKAMDMNQRWVARTPQVMLDTFPWFRGECFNLIIEDLLRTSSNRTIIVEGFRLLPSLVEPLLTDRHEAVWLLPTPEFREAAIGHRPAGWDFVKNTSDPDRARRNLFERDRLFTDLLREECNRLGLSAIEVNVGLTENGLAARVANQWRL